MTLQDLLVGVVSSFSETIDPSSLASSLFFQHNINKIKLVP